MDNTGEVPLQVPGFNNVPLDYELPLEARFTHGIAEYEQTPTVTARELAMTAAMNDITDKDDWRSMTAEQLTQWKPEMMAKYPLLSERTWEWCVSELKDKALVSEHFTRVLEAGSCVCKSDQLSIGGSFKGLDVDPFMYPLAYGRTHVLQNGSVNLHDLHANMDSMRSERSSELDVSLQAYMKVTNVIKWGKRWDGECTPTSDEAQRLYWSSKYQALPCEVDVRDDVRITSYVNNLPLGPAYGELEKIIAASIEMWNECLVQGRPPKRLCYDQDQRGCLPLRIVTFGVEWHETMPSFARAFDAVHRRQLELYKSGKAPRFYYLKRAPPLPELNEDLWHQAKAYLGPELPHNWRDNVWELLQRKADSRRYWTHPEPVVTYDNWKAGQGIERAVVRISGSHFDGELAAEPSHSRLPTNLRDFDSLQVIVQITNGSSPWQVVGHLNEHIVASAVYVCNGHGSISFRQQTYFSDETHHCRSDRPVMREGDTEYKYDTRGHYGVDTLALAEVYGFEEEALWGDWSYRHLPMQNLGTVQLPRGRLVTWPNTVEYRIEGELSYVMLQLIDPNYRICSTRNVPPQQESWAPQNIRAELKRAGKVFDRTKAELCKKEMALEQEWITGARHGKMAGMQF